MPRLKPELSRKNPYYIGKERYLELKHHCLQYGEWATRYQELSVPLQASDPATHSDASDISDVTERVALERAELSRAMERIRRVAEMTDPVLGKYIFRAVTEGRSFVWLKTVLEMPCERDMYYDRYRKFFWLLSKDKGL